MHPKGKIGHSYLMVPNQNKGLELGSNSKAPRERNTISLTKCYSLVPIALQSMKPLYKG